ncbi:MAG: tRNA (adenosine(37)-N6)-threonylcarbamoyltransferase complex dimerization subunit type 1 TsaB [Bacilli bacterium]|nr:tRNA (adenosine(37)-N6)-threonylcarbamoyltransferase complex dimerization subunit type 1 TsaB [Bacilli bacterium]
MNSLFIDTSTKYLCIGIAKDNNVIYKYQQEAIKKQSELTIPFLKKALDENNMTLNDIDEVNVTIGPGSFTGIRIGMCVAKVLASMKNIPLKAISSLNAYASLGKKIVILDAKAKRVYLGIYNDNVKVIDEMVVEIETFKEILKYYDGYDVFLYYYLIGLESEEIDVIENMNRISKTIQPVDNVDALVPIYLKDR